MPRALDVEQHLGYRILRWMLATAVICGVLVSSVQVVLDARRVSKEVVVQAAQTISVVRDVDTQSVFSIDDMLDRQAIHGLFALKPTRLARITHPTGEG